MEKHPPGRELLGPQFGMRRLEWPDTTAVEFHLRHGEGYGSSRSGLEVVDLVELRAPKAGPEHRYSAPTLEWARQWPSEEIWRARKR